MTKRVAAGTISVAATSKSLALFRLASPRSFTSRIAANAMATNGQIIAPRFCARTACFACAFDHVLLEEPPRFLLVPGSDGLDAKRSASRYVTAGIATDRTLAMNPGFIATSQVNAGTPPTIPPPVALIAALTVAANITAVNPMSRTCHNAASTAVTALNSVGSTPAPVPWYAPMWPYPSMPLRPYHAS